MHGASSRELRLQQFLQRIETYTSSLHETCNMVDQTGNVLLGANPTPPATSGVGVGLSPSVSKDNGTMIMLDNALDRLQNAIIRNNEVAQRLIGAL